FSFLIKLLYIIHQKTPRTVKKKTEAPQVDVEGLSFPSYFRYSIYAFFYLLADTNGITATSVCIVCFQKQNSYGKFIVNAYNYIYALPEKKAHHFVLFFISAFR
ncbi:hypothetical protein MKA46_07315, partial [[Clostridium] innocuum]|nr:hypothetical protein [[Clostridium] innocuum]